MPFFQARPIADIRPPAAPFRSNAPTRFDFQLRRPAIRVYAHNVPSGPHLPRFALPPAPLYLTYPARRPDFAALYNQMDRASFKERASFRSMPRFSPPRLCRTYFLFTLCTRTNDLSTLLFLKIQKHTHKSKFMQVFCSVRFLNYNAECAAFHRYFAVLQRLFAPRTLTPGLSAP